MFKCMDILYGGKDKLLNSNHGFLMGMKNKVPVTKQSSSTTAQTPKAQENPTADKEQDEEVKSTSKKALKKQAVFKLPANDFIKLDKESNTHRCDIQVPLPTNIFATQNSSLAGFGQKK